MSDRELQIEIQDSSQPSESSTCLSAALGQLLTTAEMAAWLKVSELEIERLRQREELPHIRVAGQIRFPAGLQKFMVVGGGQDGETFAATKTVFENQQTVMHVAVPSPYDAFDEQEVAQLLRCEPATIAYYTKRSNRLAYVPVGKKRLVLRKDLEDFLRRRRVRCADDIPLHRKERNS